jgi:ABC-type transport system involved in multi-copper enzyme maturation permease subunit
LFINGWRPDKALVIGTLAILFSAALMALALHYSPFAPPEGSTYPASLALWLAGHILAAIALFLLSGLMTGAFGRDVVSYFKPSARAAWLAKSDTLRDKADENEKGD